MQSVPTHALSALEAPPLSRQRALAVLIAFVIAALVITLTMAAPPARAAVTSGALFGGSTPSGLTTHSDRKSVEVGTKFSVVTSGTASGISFYKTSRNTGTHVGTLWTEKGTKLASVTFSGESATGWQKAQFAAPVALDAGKRYVVSYHAPYGQYAAKRYFAGTSASGALKLDPYGLLKHGTSSVLPTDTFKRSQYYVDVLFTPGGTVAAPPTTGFPSSANTGVPTGTSLSAYTGPCTITTAGTVIDAKTVNCSLTIRATGVKITRSKVNGTVYGATNGSTSFSISDSEISIGDRMGTGIGDGYFTATRVEVTGGNRSINCFVKCTVQSSYVHDQFRDGDGPRVGHPHRLGKHHPRQHDRLRRPGRAAGRRMLRVPHRVRRLRGGAGQRHRRQPVPAHHRWILRLRRLHGGQAVLVGRERHPVHEQRVPARFGRQVRLLGRDHRIRRQGSGQRLEQQQVVGRHDGRTVQLSLRRHHSSRTSSL